MPTPSKGPRLGGSPAHERLMLANLATSLFEHERITTTHAKAKRLRPYAERLITFARRGDLASRRQVLSVVRDKDVVHKLFADIGPRYVERPGGYTRIVKVGHRKGDNAAMAQISLVEELTVAQEAVGEAERARRGRTAPSKAPAPSTVEAAEEARDESPTAAGVVQSGRAIDIDPDAETDAELSADAAEEDHAAETDEDSSTRADMAEEPAEGAAETDDDDDDEGRASRRSGD